MKLKLIGVLFAMLSLPASSCTRFYGINVQFERNSAHLSEEQLSRLARWAEDTRTKYPSGVAILLEAGAESTELDGEHLGRMRELAARLALIDFGVTVEDVYPSERVFRSHSTGEYPDKPEDGRRVIIEYVGSHPDFTRPCVRLIQNRPLSPSSP